MIVKAQKVENRNNIFLLLKKKQKRKKIIMKIMKSQNENEEKGY